MFLGNSFVCSYTHQFYVPGKQLCVQLHTSVLCPWETALCAVTHISFMFPPTCKNRSDIATCCEKYVIAQNGSHLTVVHLTIVN